MRTIMAINDKFFGFEPRELIILSKESSKYIDGFEIYIDYNNENERNYLNKFAYECKINDMHFQVHADSSCSFETQLEYMKLLENISDMLGYKINVVMHPLTCTNKEESIKVTEEYLNNLVDRIDQNKITISLENLNDIDNIDRLNQDEILPIVCNNEKIFTTYDIGHVIAEYGNVTSINENLIPLITNVHIHTSSNSAIINHDHRPIYKNDENWNDIIKSILFLKANNYDGSIVFEYDLYICIGDSLKEKIINFCKSMDYVSERFK